MTGFFGRDWGRAIAPQASRIASWNTLSCIRGCVVKWWDLDLGDGERAALIVLAFCVMLGLICWR
jgi:hypothetical protein